MDYDTRINRLKDAIEWMKSANNMRVYFSKISRIEEVEGPSDVLNKADPDSLFEQYETAFKDCIEALEQKKMKLELTKRKLFEYYTRELMGLTGEEREIYLMQANIDPTVKKLLKKR